MEINENKIVNWKIKNILDTFIDEKNWNEYCNHYKINKLDKIPTDMKIYNEKCLVCHNDWNFIMECGHTLCIECFINWYQKNPLKCVCCKKKFSYDKSLFII